MFQYHQGNSASLDLTSPLHILQINASPRSGLAGTHPHGSHSRALNHLFAETWQRQRPQDTWCYRDVGLYPPAVISAAWLEAVFGGDGLSDATVSERLHESDVLVEELLAADIILLATPMYNYGPPAGLKAWLDNIVRINRTFAIAATDSGLIHQGLLTDKPRTAVIVSAHGEGGFAPGAPLAYKNHLHGQISAAFDLIGIDDIHVIAQEYEEMGGELLVNSKAAAQAAVRDLVGQLSQAAALTAATAV